MELTGLGFNKWFQEHQDATQMPGLSPARVTRVDRDRYLVRNEQAEIQAEPTGKLIYGAESGMDLPCVGDWVLVQYYNDATLAIVHHLLPRQSFLRRKAAGKNADYQMIASNIDAAFLMQACDSDFNLRRMERYLVMIRDGHIKPAIILSKTDLTAARGLEERIQEIRRARIDAEIFGLSNTTGAGLAELRDALKPGKTYCLLGSSGVGKTTLLNLLLGRDEFDTAPVREKDGRGRHTTARRQLNILDNGALVIDTPGMRELGMMAVEEGIDGSFSDINELADQCRFKDCTHTVEAGCAILEAVGNGGLDTGRYRSYLKLMKESAFHQMSYVERRKKDKQFGKMINKAMKELRKRKPTA